MNENIRISDLKMIKSLTGYYLGREIAEEVRIAMPIIKRV
jgi:hypothetical protein